MKRTQYIAYFKIPYKQKDNDNYQNNDNFCCGNKGENKGDGITDNEDPELNQFYYHSDHLGSSSYITNLKGSIVQHVEYVPFGEVFLEERNNKWNTPYLFNGKELDEETGLYYYGARYYSSRNSIFLSVDPLWEAKPSFSPYNYCSWNPVMRVDPDGRLDDEYTYDLITGEETKISNKGGNEHDIIHYGTDNKDGSFTDMGTIVYDKEKYQKKNASNNVDWDMVRAGTITTLGGTVSTVVGVFGISSGVGIPAGLGAILFGLPTVGFGVGRIIDGFQDGNRELPGGLAEGFDIGVGGDGTVGQMVDVFSGGLPKNVLSGTFMGYGIYNSNIGKSVFSPIDSDNFQPFVTKKDNTNIVLPKRKL